MAEPPGCAVHMVRRLPLDMASVFFDCAMAMEKAQSCEGRTVRLILTEEKYT